ncbi:MAG: elongation factor 4 [Parcubacteria group bacterium GW2011_GWA2_38_13b]|nr:MAG: elongation factor 4 [Parcubacteria group bacterium GW2011_GWA2_38_13b]
MINNFFVKSNIRNFCIIAHIDHGKSTLADRFLELTKTVEKRKMRNQFLDQMDLERERGITIKLQPVRMNYDNFILNLIDTPGHVDFNYEVSRSLAAVEGAILLVDAAKGIQAQTLANLYLAVEQGLEIIPVINKIDLPTAKTDETEKEIRNVLGISVDEEILKISAKMGMGIEDVLKKVVKSVPAPLTATDKPLRALIFDSKYDDYKGVIAYVRVVDGKVKRGDKIMAMVSKTKSEVIETGIFLPELKTKDELFAGEIGYIATGFKNVESCRVGDTIIMSQPASGISIEPLLGYKEPKPMVFASFYPQEGSDFDFLKDALSKLKLNDASLSFNVESSQALGRGFLCGFLGMLHMEIVSERLRREYGLNLVITTPSVNYKVGTSDKREAEIKTASEFPDPSRIEYVSEPWIRLEIITPSDYINNIMMLAKGTRGFYKKTEYISEKRVILAFETPLADIIADFYDDLKSVTSGYASMNYELLDFRIGDLVKMDILIAGEKVEAFSRIVPREKSRFIGRDLVGKLKEVVPPQLFTVAIQAAIGGEIIARETLKAMRKDVTGYLYGGDRTRKDKLLKKQKKGKKRLKEMGKVRISQEVFLKVLKK